MSNEFVDIVAIDTPIQASNILDDEQDGQLLLGELNSLFIDKKKKEIISDLNDILELNKVYARIDSIIEITDEIDNFESKLRLLDQLIQTDGDLREIEKVFILMKEWINVTRNMSLSEEKNEKIAHYEYKLKEHLDSKVDDAIINHDLQTMQSLLRLYSVMGTDESYIDILIEKKYYPEFLSLKQMK